MLKIERIISDSKPINKTRRFLSNITLPGLEGFSVWDVWTYFCKEIKMHGLTIRASAISFNMILAIPASILLICSLLPYLPISKQFFWELKNVIRDLTPDKNTRRIFIQFIDDLFNKQKKGLLSLGFFLTFFYATNAMAGIIRTFNRSIRVKYKCNFFNNRIRAFKLTIIIFIVLLGTLFISLGQGVVFTRIMSWMHIQDQGVKHFIQTVRWLFIVILFFYSIAFTYKHAPAVKKKDKLYTPGAFVGTFLVIFCTYVFSYWAQNMSNYSKFYGSIGSMMIIMLLIFFNAVMLLIGFEINVSIRYLKEDSKRPIKQSIY